MKRIEAAKRLYTDGLKQLARYKEMAKELGNDAELAEATKDLEANDMAVKALLNLLISIDDGETPDGWPAEAVNEKASRERLDENGLAKCGCGGKAEFGDGCKVVCGKCGITTLEQFTQEDAKSVWNLAMGW